MGLRCSLLGHDYAESEIEREREEDGKEVVVTVREFKECRSCGERSVVSENKEVTAIEDPEPNPEPPESEAVDTEPAASVATSDGESTASSGNFEPPETAEEDDGVILDDEDDEEPVERSHGEWPESDDHGQEPAERGRGEWPETDADDEGFDAQFEESEDADVQFGGGFTPEPDLEAEEDVQFVEPDPGEPSTPDDEQDDTGFTRARAAPQPDQAATSTRDGELVCPECGQVDKMADSSLRAGDICPECRKGYLSERN